MTEELKAFSIVKNELYGIELYRKALNIVESALMSLEIIKQYFYVKIDLRSETESSFISLYSKITNSYVCCYTIDYDSAKLLKEVMS